ncbi:hypothetical protein EQH57_0457 [Dictyocoela roeselum]|nr:hypothetical protein EQH57_0457 [Dictyocoela roeselum]
MRLRIAFMVCWLVWIFRSRLKILLSLEHGRGTAPTRDGIAARKSDWKTIIIAILTYTFFISLSFKRAKRVFCLKEKKDKISQPISKMKDDFNFDLKQFEE